MKSKMIIILFSMFTALAMTNSFAKTAETSGDPVYLTVFNNWFQPIKVEEGFWGRRKILVYPGRVYDWRMFTGTISRLGISYKHNGMWEQIPGCPEGGFYYGITVYVKPSIWDKEMPMCEVRLNNIR